MSGELSSSFTFSPEVAEATEKDLDLQIIAIETRIDRLVDKAKITDQEGQRIPLLSWILKLTSNKEELTTLSKALPRAAELVAELNELKTQKSIYALAKKDPLRLQWMFGDFSSDIDDMTSNLERLNNNDA